MSAPVIPGVATDGLKPADLLWASILNKPLLFPPSPHSHVAGDLPVNIAFKDQANTFTADQNFLLGNSYSDFYLKHDGYTLQSKSLNINNTGAAGGWGSQHGFTGSGGADLGGYGAVGNTNTIDHYWIGPNFTDPNVVITSAGMRVYGTSGAGHVGISRALSSNTGYVEWFRGSGQSNPGARQGYMGYDSGNDITIQNEQGGYLKANSMMVAGASTASSGTRIIGSTYDGNAPAHFIGGLVAERSSTAVGLAWGMYQEDTASWLSGWNYASVSRSALLLSPTGLKMLTTAVTTANPGVALPSQPFEVFAISPEGRMTLSAQQPILKFDTNTIWLADGIEWTSNGGGQLEASIKHVTNSGDMEIKVGRGVGWGGALNVVIDAVQVLSVTPANLSVAGTMTTLATTGVASPGSIALAIRDSSSNGYGFDFNLEGVSTGDLSLTRVVAGNVSQVMTFQRATGNVGIGTTTPVTKLDVKGDALFRDAADTSGFRGISITPAPYDGSQYIRAMGFGGTFSIVSASTANGLDDAYVRFNPGFGLIDFGTGLSGGAATQRMRITDSGNVLIGSTFDNGSRLQVTGNIAAINPGVSAVALIEAQSTSTSGFAALRLYASNNFGASIGGEMRGMSLAAGGHGGGALAFFTSNPAAVQSERMRIDWSGNVGIGTTTHNTL